MNQILEIIIIVSLGLWVLYEFYFHTAILFYKWKKKPNKEIEGISLIISARNEFENLKKSIPLWQQQEIEKFEIVLVDDRSWDGTGNLIDQFAENDPRIQVVHIKDQGNFHFGKKYALMLAIKKAKYNHFLFSDADCFPSSQRIALFAEQMFSANYNLILGYAPFSHAHGLVGLFQKFENFTTAFNYFNFAARNKTYMGVGRFLGYTRELYDNVNGFKGHYHLPYGDDDLFVQTVAKKARVALVHPANFIESKAKQTFGEWFHQRKRHLAASNHYLKRFKMLLSLPYILNLIFYAAMVVGAFVLKTDVMLLSIFLGIRIGVGILIGLINGLLFKKVLLGLFMPFWEIIVLIVQPFIYLSATKNPPKNW